MDNWFNDTPLRSDLKKQGFYVTGTVRVNKKGLDKRVIMLKAEETALKKNPGICRYSSQADLCFLAWCDKRPVHMISNA